jgi:SnoaL-like domain
MSVAATTVPAGDILAIEQVLAQVDHLYDARAWDRLGSVYSEDVEVDRGSFGAGIGVLVGLQAVVDEMAQSWQPRAHLLSTIVLSSGEQPGEVRALSQWVGVIEDGSVHCGAYNDVLRAGRWGWRICIRRYLPRLEAGLEYRDGRYQHPSASSAWKHPQALDPADLDSVQGALRDSVPADADVRDILALRELVKRCSHTVDAGVWDSFDEILTPDAVWDGSAFPQAPFRLEGLPSIISHHASATHPLSHHVTNIDVQVRGADEAFVESKYVLISDDGTVTSGDLLDSVIRTPAGWRIAHRELRPRRC